MYYLTLIVVIIGFLMTGCAPASQHDDMAHMDSMAAGGGATYSVDPASTGSGIAFVIRKNGNVLTDFGIAHTKPMHLIVVRDDLTHFSHLHPVMGSGGVWSIPFTPNAGGTYWLYADFVDANGTPTVQRFSKTFAGNVGTYGLVPDSATTKKTDGISVRFTATANGKQTTLTYDATKGGKPVTLEDYLGAKGHAIVLTADGEYVHAHADTNVLSFQATLPSVNALYRTFVEFQTEGKLHDVSFDIVTLTD